VAHQTNTKTTLRQTYKTSRRHRKYKRKKLYRRKQILLRCTLMIGPQRSMKIPAQESEICI
jgi:hypothetical protein